METNGSRAFRGECDLPSTPEDLTGFVLTCTSHTDTFVNPNWKPVMPCHLTFSQMGWSKAQEHKELRPQALKPGIALPHFCPFQRITNNTWLSVLIRAAFWNRRRGWLRVHWPVNPSSASRGSDIQNCPSPRALLNGSAEHFVFHYWITWAISTLGGCQEAYLGKSGSKEAPGGKT